MKRRPARVIGAFPTWGWRLAPFLILLVALGLRFFRIASQSLWADEGNSLSLALRGVPAITRAVVAHDIHPPLYYYALHFWLRAFGTTELALRGLSAFLGVALVGQVYLLGRILFGRSVGLVAMSLAAISPLGVYYSQETRMYALAGVFSLGASLLLILWLEGLSQSRNRRLWLAGYALATLLSLYSHYLAACVMLAGWAIFAFWWWREERIRSRGALAAWAITQGAVLVLYLPWLWLARERLRTWPAVSEPLAPGELARQALSTFSLGLTADLALALLALPLYAVALVVGFFPWRRDRWREEAGGIGVALALMVVPLGLIYVLSWRRSLYSPKFLLMAVPPFYLLLARGILLPARLASACGKSLLRPVGRVVTVLAFVTLGLAAGKSLHNYYYNPKYGRDDYRGIAHYIASREASRQAILVNAPGQVDVFSYYYHGDLPVYPLPRQRPLDREATLAELEGMVAGRNKIYAVFWATDESDPERLIEGWLDAHAFKGVDRWYGNVRLVMYGLAAGAKEEGPEEVRDYILGGRIRFLGFTLRMESLAPGEVLPVTLFWQALTEIEERYKVFVHLVDGEGKLVGQRDAEPGGGAKLTTLWRKGERVVDNYGLLVPLGTPPGEYHLIVGMYGITSGQRLPLTSGEGLGQEHMPLGQVLVVRPPSFPPPEALEIQHRKHLSFESIALIGYDAFKRGFGHQPEEPLFPGDILELRLYWQALRKPSEDQVFSRSLKGAKEAVLLEEFHPAGPLHPPSSWVRGELVRELHYLSLPRDLPPGRYLLYLHSRKGEAKALGEIILR